MHNLCKICNLWTLQAHGWCKVLAFICTYTRVYMRMWKLCRKVPKLLKYMHESKKSSKVWKDIHRNAHAYTEIVISIAELHNCPRALHIFIKPQILTKMSVEMEFYLCSTSHVKRNPQSCMPLDTNPPTPAALLQSSPTNTDLEDISHLVRQRLSQEQPQGGDKELVKEFQICPSTLA